MKDWNIKLPFDTLNDSEFSMIKSQDNMYDLLVESNLILLKIDLKYYKPTELLLFYYEYCISDTILTPIALKICTRLLPNPYKKPFEDEQKLRTLIKSKFKDIVKVKTKGIEKLHLKCNPFYDFTDVIEYINNKDFITQVKSLYHLCPPVLEALPLVFKLWSQVRNSTGLDSLLMAVFYRIFHHNRNIKFDLDFIYTAGLRLFKLPAKHAPLDISFHHRMQEKPEEIFGKVVVLIGDVQRLENLINAFEIFIHPSNHGSYSISISIFVQSILETLIIEQNGTIEICKLLSPMVRTMLFSKHISVIQNAETSLKYLSYLVPSEVDQFINIAIPALGSTEYHRAMACLGGLSSIIPALCKTHHHPSGNKYVVSLLINVARDIDMNNQARAMGSLVLIYCLTSHIPIVLAKDSKLDPETRASTELFEEFVLTFLDRILSLFENLPANYASQHSDIDENRVLNLALFCCHIVFDHLSSELEDSVLKSFEQKMGNVVPAATIVFGKLLALVAPRRPWKKLKLWKTAASIMRSELDGGSCQVSEKGTFHHDMLASDSTFHWYQSIVIQTIFGMGDHIIPILSEIDTIILDSLNLQAMLAWKWGAWMLQLTIQELVSYAPLEYHGENFDLTKNAEFWEWGSEVNFDSLAINWRVPTDEGIEKAVSLAMKYSQLALDKLAEEPEKWLSVLKSIASASRLFLQKPPRDSQNKNHVIGSHFRQWNDQASKILDKITSAFENSQSLSEKKNRILVLDIIELLVGRTKINSPFPRGVINGAKLAFKAGKIPTALPRSFWVERMYRLVIMRAILETGLDIPDPLVDKVFEVVFKAATCSFDDERVKARHCISRILEKFPKLSGLVFQKGLDLLLNLSASISDKITLEIEDSIKGVLNIFDLTATKNFYTGNLEHMGNLLEVLGKLEAIDKPTILESVERVGKVLCQTPKISTKYDGIKSQSIFFEKIAEGLQRNWWRYSVLVFKILESAVGDTTIVPGIIYECLWKGMIHDLPVVRDAAASALSSILKEVRLKHTKMDNWKQITNRNAPEFSKIFKMIEFNLDDNENIIFVDTYLGGYHQPLKEVYYHDASNVLHSEFSFPTMIDDETHWKLLLDFAQQDSPQSPLNSKRIKVFKSFFALSGTQKLSKVLPILSELISKFEDVNAQKASAEIITSIIQGSKYWNASDLKKLNSDIFTLLLKALDQATSETVDYWLDCLRMIFKGRDINRCKAIVNYYLNADLEVGSHSFFATKKQLMILQMILLLFGFSLRNFSTRIVEKLLLLRSSPYQEVRDATGHCLATSLEMFRYEGLSIVEVIDRVNMNEDSDLPVLPLIKNALDEIKNSGGQVTKELLNISRTFATMFMSFLSFYRSNGAVNYLRDFVQLTFEMLDYGDQELSQTSQRLALLFSNYANTTKSCSEILDYLMALCTAENVTSMNTPWYLKTKVIPVIQTVYFRHLFCLGTHFKDKIMWFLCTMIEDPQAEVRSLASVALSGVVMCSARELVDSIKEKYSKKLNETKLPKKRSEASNFSAILVARHSSILALSALVLAFPYSMPSWMPEVLVLLAECAHDPIPISTTVNHTFGEFKRTHQDTWEQDRESFDDDQLYIVTELLYSPGYYA